MMIKALNLRGLNFRESKGVPIPLTTEICMHKYGADATWSHGTDLYKPNLEGHGFDGEINAFKYNLQMTIWENPWYGGKIQKECIDMKNTGRVGFGVYYMTWYWRDPFTDIVGGIPDFGSTVWTSKAYEKGIITEDMIGKPKGRDYPFITDLYSLTNGKYGYDINTGNIGEIDVVTKVMEEHYNWFKNAFGRYPSSAGYAYGSDGLKNKLAEYYIGVRNSVWDVKNYNYKSESIYSRSIKNTTRQNDMQGTREEKNILCAEYLTNAINANGWYRDFSHWHWCKDTELEDFFRTQREAMEGHNVVSLDFGTAIEYMWLRDMCTKVDVYQKDNKIIIEGDFNNMHNIPINTIKTTLSVKINLAGTILENKNLKSNYEVIKISQNEYIVEVPLYGVTVLQTDATGKYLDLSLPKILSIVRKNNEIIVNTDKETNLVLFKVPKNQELYNASIVKRSNGYKHTHIVYMEQLYINDYDFYVGVISKEKQSVLSDKINL